MNAFTFYEFFADGGMAREGLGPQWACAFANDIDARKGRSYAANFGRDGLKVGDVARLTTADLPYGAEIGPVDLAWGSPPCQDVSLAGDRAGLDETRSGAFWPFMRLMQGLRSEGRAPKMIVIENVTGLLTSHAGADFDAICDALAEASYRFGTVIIDAALLVPQSRERVFIVAVNNAIAIPASIVRTSPTAPFHSSAVIAASKRNAEYAPIWWRLPIPPLRNAVFADIIEDASTGVPWHSRADTDRLIAMMAPTHLAKLEEAQRASLSKRMVGGLYKRIQARGWRQSPARRGSLRRHRRLPANADRRIQPPDDRDRRGRLRAIAAVVATRGRSVDGLGRQLPATRQLQRSLRPHG